jgi:hypothetical protein
MRARAIAGVAAFALASWILLAIFRTHAPEDGEQSLASSASCRDCHAQIFQEWSESWHARAWSDPEVRQLSNDFQNADCIDCHAPRPVFETGVGQRVLPRASRRAEGVDCIACHRLSGETSSVAGTRDVPSAPCRPKATPELASAQLCAGCHDQHATVRQWLASEYAARGIDCIACHMRERVEGSSERRHHRMSGGHDLELVKRAVELRVRRESGAWMVELENVGAGHNFPTDERSRAADLFWRPASDSNGAWRFLYRFRSPYRHEVDLEDTTLAAREVRRVAIESPDASQGVEVALFFKTKPYWLDPEHPDPEREARLVHRISVAP